MGVLYLVRHGQARAQAYGAGAWAQAEGGLTELGAEQAQRAGGALAGRVGRIDHVVSGDLARQRETLRRVAEQIPDCAEPSIDSRWNEYDIDSILGDRERTENATARGFQTQLDDALADWIRRIAVGSETYAQYRARADSALESVVEQAGSGRTVLAVSSAGTIAAIVASLWGVDDAHWLAMARTMINTSVTKIIVGSSGCSVVSVNDHAHVDRADDRRLMTFR